MLINFIDAIPDSSPHCGNCIFFKETKDDGLFDFCTQKEKKTPSFGVCDDWKYKQTIQNEKE